MFLFVHLKVFLSVWLYRLLLIVKHRFFHTHEFTDCVCLKGVQQMFQPILKMFSVLIDDLRHDLSFSVVNLIRCWHILVEGIACIFFRWMGGSDDIWIWHVFFLCLLGIEHLCQIGYGLFAWWVLELFLPPFRDLLNIVEISFVDHFFHIHFQI